MSVKKEECPSASFVEVTAQQGYISSRTTEETRCGSIDTPWLLKVRSQSGAITCQMELIAFYSLILISKWSLAFRTNNYYRLLIAHCFGQNFEEYFMYKYKRHLRINVEKVPVA